MMRLLLLLLLLPHLAAAAETFGRRDDVRAFVAEMHERHGFDADALAALFARTRSDPAVIKAIMPPKDPSIRSWQAYRERFVEPRRIAAGLRFWQDHAAALAQAEARYGVPAEIILGILGVETIYGRHTGRFQTFAALATLAFDYPPRAALFRRELEALLLLARAEKREPLSYKGSFAGALGLPQFLPSSLTHWGTDFDGNGRVDLADPTDAIGSVANFLKEHGWQKDGPVAVPTVVEGEAATWDGSPPQPTVLVDLVTPNAPTEYRLGYQNFYVLTRYNRSSFYAMAVFDLAQALKAAR